MLQTNAQRVLAAAQADAVYTTCDYLKRYLTGFNIEDGYVITDRSGTTMYTDARYMESAKKFFADKAGYAVEEINASNRANLLLKQYKKVAVPFAQVSVAEYNALPDGVEFVDATTAFCESMAVKNQAELLKIQKACKIAEEGFLKLLPEIKEGMTENEVAALLEYNMRSLGAQGLAFETIVAFGANASVPHHETGDTVLKFGDEILIDFGCRVDGYCSDITRTFLFGDDGKHRKFKDIYAAVLAAQRLVIDNFKSGMTGKAGDAIARDYLKSKDLAQYFTHSLGHGIGLNIHEEPRVSPRSEQVFSDGMVFSDEPGVYLEGELGVRIEDTVTLENGKVKSFMTLTDKELIIL